MSAVSPTCEFRFLAARARSMKIAASAQLLTLQSGMDSGIGSWRSGVLGGIYGSRTELPCRQFPLCLIQRSETPAWTGRSKYVDKAT